MAATGTFARNFAGKNFEANGAGEKLENLH
jgi:hypothetical protein